MIFHLLLRQCFFSFYGKSFGDDAVVTSYKNFLSLFENRRNAVCVCVCACVPMLQQPEKGKLVPKGVLEGRPQSNYRTEQMVTTRAEVDIVRLEAASRNATEMNGRSRCGLLLDQNDHTLGKLKWQIK